MMPSSWYHREMQSIRETRLRKTAARNREVGWPRRRSRRSRREV